MAQTFDIRFARTEGLAALFEAPTNRFRWKGAGRLSIDAQGISIAVRRGLLSLFSPHRSHRIAAAELTEVYREGNALRLEFGSDQRREVLPIWVAGTGDAAEIVKLLPTIRTVELEHSTRVPRSFRIDMRAVLWLVLLAVLVAGALAVPLRALQTAVAVPEPAALVVEPLVPAQAGAAAGIPTVAATPEPGIQSIQPATAAHDVARRQQALFESELAGLRGQYDYLRGSANADALDAMEPAWWAITFRIETSEEMSGPAFLGFREAQLAAVSSWRAALSLHAAGLRLSDERLIALAAKQRELAELNEQLVRLYLP